jgi:hypothetical protein
MVNFCAFVSFLLTNECLKSPKESLKIHSKNFMLLYIKQKRNLSNILRKKWKFTASKLAESPSIHNESVMMFTKTSADDAHALVFNEFKHTQKIF